MNYKLAGNKLEASMSLDDIISFMQLQKYNADLREEQARNAKARTTRTAETAATSSTKADAAVEDAVAVAAAKDTPRRSSTIKDRIQK